MSSSLLLSSSSTTTPEAAEESNGTCSQFWSWDDLVGVDNDSIPFTQQQQQQQQVEDFSSAFPLDPLQHVDFSSSNDNKNDSNSKIDNSKVDSNSKIENNNQDNNNKNTEASLMPPRSTDSHSTCSSSSTMMMANRSSQPKLHHYHYPTSPLGSGAATATGSSSPTGSSPTVLRSYVHHNHHQQQSAVTAARIPPPPPPPPHPWPKSCVSALNAAAVALKQQQQQTTTNPQQQQQQPMHGAYKSTSQRKLDSSHNNHVTTKRESSPVRKQQQQQQNILRPPPPPPPPPPPTTRTRTLKDAPKQHHHINNQLTHQNSHTKQQTPIPPPPSYTCSSRRRFAARASTRTTPRTTATTRPSLASYLKKSSTVASTSSRSILSSGSNASSVDKSIQSCPTTIAMHQHAGALRGRQAQMLHQPPRPLSSRNVMTGTVRSGHISRDASRSKSPASSTYRTPSCTTRTSTTSGAAAPGTGASSGAAARRIGSTGTGASSGAAARSIGTTGGTRRALSPPSYTSSSSPRRSLSPLKSSLPPSSSSCCNRSVSSLKSSPERSSFHHPRPIPLDDADDLSGSCSGSFVSVRTSPGRLADILSATSTSSPLSMPKTIGIKPRTMLGPQRQMQQQQQLQHPRRGVSETSSPIVIPAVPAPPRGRQPHGPTTATTRISTSMVPTSTTRFGLRHGLDSNVGGRKSPSILMNSTTLGNQRSRSVSLPRKRNTATSAVATAPTSSSASVSSSRSATRALRNASTAAVSGSGGGGPLLGMGTTWKKRMENTDKIVTQKPDSVDRMSPATTSSNVEDETESSNSYSTRGGVESAPTETEPQQAHDSSSSSQNNKVIGRFKRAATRFRQGVGNIITIQPRSGARGGGGKVEDMVTKINNGNSNHSNKQRKSLRCLHQIVLIQAQIRGFLARTAYRNQVQAAIKIQSLVRAMKPRLKFKARMLKRRLKQLEKLKRRDLKHIRRETQCMQMAIRDDAKKAYNLQQFAILKGKQQKAERAAALIKALQGHNKKLRSQGKHFEEACTAQVETMLDAIIANADETLRVLRDIEVEQTKKSGSAKSVTRKPVR